jgi:putative hydrolase of the HAD superfamily
MVPVPVSVGAAPGMSLSMSGLARPDAVLLDAGGVLVLPDGDRIADTFRRAELPVPSHSQLVDAHHRAAARFCERLDVEADWVGAWKDYLHDYALECTPGDALIDLDDLHRHLDSEFADAALWSTPVPDVREHLERLATTGVRLGVISNADGLMAQRLRSLEILQVGPGLGVSVECVIDSGDVGVMKPDPRIFEIALHAMGIEPAQAWYVGDMPAFDVVGARRAGLRPWIIDPLGLHVEENYDCVRSLDELAATIETL